MAEILEAVAVAAHGALLEEDVDGLGLCGLRTAQADLDAVVFVGADGAVFEDDLAEEVPRVVRGDGDA